MGNLLRHHQRGMGTVMTETETDNMPGRGPGQPPVGPPVKFSCPPLLLAELDRVAEERRCSRAAAIRYLLRTALEPWVSIQIRADGRVERVCEHGVGHPTPTSARLYDGVHGCDGCCHTAAWVAAEEPMRGAQ